jgi:hypothetical protein
MGAMTAEEYERRCRLRTIPGSIINRWWRQPEHQVPFPFHEKADPALCTRSCRRSILVILCK